MDNNKIIYDWLSFVVHGFSIEDVLFILGLDGQTFQHLKGSHGYINRLFFESISIHYDGAPNQGIWVEMSGQGCRAFETFGHGDYNYLFNLIIENPFQFHVTRLDVACDDWSGMLDINRICDDVRNLNWVGRFRSWESISSSSGCSVILGSRQSECLLRIYDKAKERKRSDVPHWIRVEFQMRDDRALQYIKLVNTFSSGVLLSLVLNNYCRFVIPNDNDINKSRWLTVGYWADFLCNISEHISIYEKPKIDYNLCKLKSFVFHQAGGAIETALSIFGSDGFLSILEDYSADREVNPKYVNLLRSYGLISDIEKLKTE